MHSACSVAGLLSFSFVLPSCLPDESAALWDDEEADQIFSLTLVELRPDGNHVVTQSTIRLSEQIAIRELEESSPTEKGFASARSALSIDTGCATTSLRIWNAENYVGNQICFSGTGVADLRYLEWCVLGLCTEWEGHVESFKTGQYVFHSSDTGTNCNPYCSDIACCQSCGQRAASTSVSPAAGCENGARYVDRGGCKPC